jgi:hypothetical protein
MFDFIFSVYARIIRSIMRATTTPTVASFMLPQLRGRIVGKDCDQDIPPIMIRKYKVWDWSMMGAVLQTEDNVIWIDSTGIPDHVWISTIDWIIARQSQ